MSWIDGLAPCWELGKDCVVDWSAWGAIGSIAAAGVTVVAAGIALWIGVLPVFLRRAQARALARIAFKRSGIGMLHAAASHLIMDQPVRTGMEDNVARISFEHVDPGPLRDLIPYFDVMPRSVADAVSDGIVEIELAQRLLGPRPYFGNGELLQGPDGAIFEEVKSALERANASLSDYASEQQDRDYPKQSVVLANSLMRLAEEANGVEGITELELRRRVVGTR